MDNLRFKATNKEYFPAAIVFLVWTIPFFVMSVKGLLTMGPDDNKTLQIVGVAVMGALVPIALVNLVHALIFRVVIEDMTIKVRDVLGTRKMDINSGITCTCKLKENIGRDHRTRTWYYIIRLDDGTKKLKFKLFYKSDVEQFISILTDACVSVQRDDLR